MKKALLVFGMCFLLSIPKVYALTISQIPLADIEFEYANSGEYLGTVIGENDDVLTVQTALEELGMDMEAMRSPKVPKISDRILSYER